MNWSTDRRGFLAAGGAFLATLASALGRPAFQRSSRSSMMSRMPRSFASTGFFPILPPERLAHRDDV